MNNVFLLQLDGVSGPVLDHALKDNLMPFTKSLLEKGWVKRDFFCGLPSTTPASQISLLYGVNDVLVGFWFAMKKEKKTFLPVLNPESMHYIEKLVSAKSQGSIVAGGATVFSLFSGGAKDSLSVSGVTKASKNILPVVSFFFNPFRVFAFGLKLIAFLIIDHKEYVTASTHRASAPMRIFHVLKRMAEEIIDGEIALFLSKRMIRKKHPVIYVDFTGYDEIAHIYGPVSRFARYYLSLLDIYVRHCYEALAKSATPYEFVLISDHGQIDNVPYEKFTGESFAQSMKRLYPSMRFSHHTLGVDYAKNALNDLAFFESGNITNVYDLQREEILTRDSLEKKFPDFYRKVSELPGIECVIGRDEQKVPIVCIQGVASKLSKDSKNLFPTLNEKERLLAVRSLHTMLTSPYVGDAILVGKIYEDHCIGLAQTLGVHGGIGGNQTKSFCISRRVSFDEAKVNDYSDIYRVLHNYIYGADLKSN